MELSQTNGIMEGYKGQCKSCPIEPYTEEGHRADSYGCLPSFAEMLKWQQDTGKIWACHSNPKKPCSGFIGVMNKDNIKWDLTKGLITEDDTLETIYEEHQH